MKNKINNCLEAGILPDNTLLVCDMECEQYDSLDAYLLRGVDKLGYRMRYSHGRLQIYEIPSEPHEKISRKIDLLAGFYNTRHGVPFDRPLNPSGSTKYFFQNCRLEPDCSYSNTLNPLNDAPRDLHGTQWPNIVVEVGYSETYESIFDTVPIYFSSEHIRAVIVINLVRSRRGVYNTFR